MKQRNPFVVLLLSIITLGIYDIYWLVKTKGVLNKKTNIHTSTIWLLFFPYILIVALIVIAIIFAAHSTPHSTYSANQDPNLSSNSSPAFTLVIVLVEFIGFLVIVPITFYWFFKFSKAINEYTNGELNTGVTFLLLWMLHFIGVIIVQDKFNDMILAGRDNGIQLQPVAATYPVAPAPINPQPQAEQTENPNPDTQSTPLLPAPAQPTAPVRTPNAPPTDRHHRHRVHPDSSSES